MIVSLRCSVSASRSSPGVLSRRKSHSQRMIGLAACVSSLSPSIFARAHTAKTTIARTTTPHVIARRAVQGLRRRTRGASGPVIVAAPTGP